MVDHLDEPIGDPAAINTFLICDGRAGRRRQGDAVRHGRGRAVRRLPQAPRLRPRRALPAAAAAGSARHRSSGRRPASRWQSATAACAPSALGKRFLSFADLPEEAAFRRSYTMYDPGELARLLGPDLAPHVDDGLERAPAGLRRHRSCDDHVNRMCLADARLFLPGLNLAYTDRASMAASTEVRVPFVDVEVVRAAFPLPGRAKIDGRPARLRSSRPPSRGFPKEIVHRPKGRSARRCGRG